MRATDALAVAVTTLLGAATGWILAGALGAAVGAITSGLVALLGVRAGVRPGLIAAVLLGTKRTRCGAHGCNDAQYHNHAPARWWHNDCIPGDSSR